MQYCAMGYGEWLVDRMGHAVAKEKNNFQMANLE